MAELILLTCSGAVAELRLNRPEKRNALDGAMLKALARLCGRIERDDAVRAVLLSGEGSAFCAGGDIDAWSGTGPDEFGRHWIRDGHAVLESLARLRQPVIAVLDGDALGGGLELAACADYRVAEAHVRIGQPETSLGIIPGWSGTQRLSRRFGAQLVRRMALFGDVFSAEEALAMGIVDVVAPAGEGMAAAREIAGRVAGRGARATELVKMVINAAEGEEGGRVVEALAGTIAAASPELAEGLAAFRVRRRSRSDGAKERGGRDSA